MKRIVGSVAFALYLGWLAEGTVLEQVAMGISLYAFATCLQRISHRIAILECIGAIAALELLFVPVVTYWVEPSVMAADSSDYLVFIIPAYSAFFLGLFWFTKPPEHVQHRSYIMATRAYLQDKQGAAIALLIIGLAGFVVKITVLDAPSFISALPYSCLFISALYAHYSRSPFRRFVIGTVLLALLIYTVQEGMFGDLFLWILLLGLFVLAGRAKPLPMTLKGVFTTMAMLVLLLIQSIKMEYRVNTWGRQRDERNGSAGLMISLLYDRWQHPEKVVNGVHSLLALTRFNQGAIVGNAMAKVPANEPYAGGEVLLSVVHPFVPRFLWANKPITGGHENIRRFTSLPQHKSSSTNISPIGEGYVNFGYGGILFAFAYGLLLAVCFKIVLVRAIRIPSVLLWLPALFFGCLTMETDLLSTWGSLVNTAVFVAGLYWILNRLAIKI